MWPEPLPVEVLYEDAWLAVVLKPAGMLIHPTRKVKTGTLANALAWLWNPQLRNLERPQPAGPAIRPGFPHRLDRETSGLLIVAKNQMTLRRLAQAFRRREVDKRYTAIVAGCVASDALEVHAGIGRVPGEKPYWRAVENGKAATTRLRVLKRRAGLSLVELEPLTGRTHQLRIHCAHIGHPILGDNLYGGPPAPRLCLHATSVALRHPETGRLLRFGSEPPGDMQACFVDTGQEPCNLF
jgi:23S rRNA pseudouridine1911/1915/1917 synthase